MRVCALALIGIAAVALTASIETADARINCGPGMNSDGYGCVPIGVTRGYRHHYNYGGRSDHYYRARPRGPRDCGPGMNSDGYRCVPIRGIYRRY